MNNNEQLFSVPEFVITFLERCGAIAENKGYALWELLVPDELVSVLGHDILVLAFDYEIAEENPGSIFVTAGSTFLDTIIRLAADYGRYTAHYWPGGNLSTTKNIENKINQAVNYKHCQPPRVTLQWLADNIYYGFNFKVIYSTYEKTEEIITVYINGWSGLPVKDFALHLKTIVPIEKPVYQITGIPLRPLTKLYQKACQEAEAVITENSAKIQDNANELRQNELGKTDKYYQALIDEKDRKIAASTDEVKAEKLKMQLSAIKAEYERRREDTTKRYLVEVDIYLDYLTAYHIPCEVIRLEMKHKNTNIKHHLLYNRLMSQIESPSCAQCDRPVNTLQPDGSARLCCRFCISERSKKTQK